MPRQARAAEVERPTRSGPCRSATAARPTTRAIPAEPARAAPPHPPRDGGQGPQKAQGARPGPEGPPPAAAWGHPGRHGPPWATWRPLPRAIRTTERIGAAGTGPSWPTPAGPTPRPSETTEAEPLPHATDKPTPFRGGYLNHAMIGVMVFSFARIGAVVGMKGEDYYQNGKRWWLRLHEKGGKFHKAPAHHNAEAYLDAYLHAASIADDRKGSLFRSAAGKTGTLTGQPLERRNALDMVKRRARAAGLSERMDRRIMPENLRFSPSSGFQQIPGFSPRNPRHFSGSGGSAFLGLEPVFPRGKSTTSCTRKPFPVNLGLGATACGHSRLCDISGWIRLGPQRPEARKTTKVTFPRRETIRTTLGARVPRNGRVSCVPKCRKVGRSRERNHLRVQAQATPL